MSDEWDMTDVIDWMLAADKVRDALEAELDRVDDAMHVSGMPMAGWRQWPNLILGGALYAVSGLGDDESICRIASGLAAYEASKRGADYEPSE